MTNIVNTPYAMFFDADGAALDAGQIYIGTAGVDPRTSPLTAYWDDAMSITAAQPIRTLSGYPVYQGSPGNIHVNADSFSLLVLDKNGAQVYYAQSATGGGAGSRGSVQEQVATAGQTLFTFSGIASAAITVFVNGVRLATADYTRSGNNVTLLVAASAGDIVTVQTWASISTINTASADDVTYNATDISTAGSVAEKLNAFRNPMDDPWSAVGDGAADDTAAVIAASALAYAEGKPLVLTGDHRITANTTLQADILVLGGTLQPAAGVTVTLRGIVTAGNVRVFGGSGSVVGVRDVRPEWWGAVADGATDSLAALNAAHTCVQASKTSRGQEQVIRLSGGTYGVSDAWIVRPTADCNLRIRGAGTIFGGTRITDLASFTSTANPTVQIAGSADAIQMISDWEFSGVAIIKGAGANFVGLQIGDNDPTKKLIGQTWQKVEDVFVEGYTVGTKIIHARQIRFSRLACWSNGVASAVIPLQITTNGWFTGDLSFDDACQFVSNSSTLVSTKCVQILCESGDYNPATGANQIAGITFGNVDLYTGTRAIEIFCRNGGYVSDIWLNGTQFDQESTHGLYIECFKDSVTTPVVANINVNGAYFSRNLNYTIDLYSNTGGIIREVSIANCYSNSGQKEFVVCGGAGVENVSVNNNRIVNNNNQTGYVIDLGTANIASAIGNKLSRTDGASFPNYMIRVALGANNYVVRDNISAGLAATGVVLDSGGAVTKSVGDNI